MKEWEIWVEGYATNGERSQASFIGKSMGETFNEACENFQYPEDVKNPYCNCLYNGATEYFHRKGDKLRLDTKPDGSLRINSIGNYSIWACGLFDNETAARKSFG